MKTTLLLTIAAVIFSACGGATTNNDQRSSAGASQQASPASTSGTPVPKDGTYVGSGKVTKINANAGSIEIDHKEIEGLMPARKLEFNVKDKSILKDLKVGDEVKFEVEYKHPTQTIATIKKI